MFVFRPPRMPKAPRPKRRKGINSGGYRPTGGGTTSTHNRPYPTAGYPAPPPASPGGGGDPGYGGMIGTSPDLSGLEAEYGAASRENAASRDAALRRYVISYGQLPDFASLGISDSAKGFLKNALNQQTRDLAAKAEAEGLSIHARQAKDNMVASRRIPATLAGRGLLRSGQTGYDLGEQGQNYKITQYDTLNELLGNVEGTVGNYMSGERERAIALAQARIAAAYDAYQNYGDSYDQQQAAGEYGQSLAPNSMPGDQPIRYGSGANPYSAQSQRASAQQQRSAAQRRAAQRAVATWRRSQRARRRSGY